MYSNDEIIQKLKELGKMSEWDNMPDSIVKKIGAKEKYGIRVSLEYDVDKELSFVFSIPNCDDAYDYETITIEDVFSLTSHLPHPKFGEKNAN